MYKYNSKYCSTTQFALVESEDAEPQIQSNHGD